MKIRRFHFGVAVGVLCAATLVFTVRRRVADAQRRRAPLPTSAQQNSARHASETAAAVARIVHPVVIENVIEGFDPTRARLEHDRLVEDLPGDRHAVLTLEPAWQNGIAALVAGYAMPRATVVVMDTDTGRIRAYVSHGERGAGDLVRDATAPAASVFKIVTASLLVQRGIADDTVTCFSGGFHAITPRDLVADPRRDRDCITLAEAFGRSANTVFARRAVERLTPVDLLAGARAWGFGEPVPFDAPVAVGGVDVPDTGLEFARASAGFWHSHLSGIHAAMLAQGIARGGEMLRPYVIESITDGHGIQLAVGGQHAWRRAVSPEVAQALGRMMTHSVSEGTAFHAFHDNAGRAFLPGIDVGGKTGTLTGDRPYRAYTWFVGNAANASTRVSFAVMVANGPVWRIRAAALARQVLQIVYHGRATN